MKRLGTYAALCKKGDGGGGAFQIAIGCSDVITITVQEQCLRQGVANFVISQLNSRVQVTT